MVNWSRFQSTRLGSITTRLHVHRADSFSSPAGAVAQVTLNTAWFDPTRGVWIVTFEFPGAGQHTAIEVNAGGILMGIRVTDGNVYAYRGSEMHGLDAALPGGSTRVVQGYGQRGAFAARNGTVVQLSMARTPRIADVCLGVSVAAMLQLDSRMISFGYVGVDATSAEIAAYSALDEWGELIAYIGANFIDGFIATASQLNTAINT